jgi:diguanylate cyclase (GGDEF)-like protein/PAS domain S-box-containing protein
MSISFFQSLRFRLIASVVAIEIIMLSIMVWNNVEFIYRSHTERLHETARSTIWQFTNAAGSYMAEVNYAGLQELAQNLIHQNEVSYLIVVDAKNRPVIQLGRKLNQISELSSEHPTNNSGNIYEIASNISIADLHLGKVFMGFSLQYMLDSIRDARNRSISIAVTEIALSILVTIILGIRLTKNLQALAAAAHRVGAGHYDETLAIARNDEVGMTAQAFNKMVQDIAERTSRIHESESSIRLLMDSTAEAIVGINTESICIFVNQACIDILGYDSADQIIGKDFHELAHHHYPDGREYPGSECRIRIGAKENDAFYTDEETYIRADGSFFPVEVRTHLISHNGVRTGIVMTFTDITERKQAHANIERLNKELSLLLESTGEGIFGVDTDMKCTFVNQAATRLLGYSIQGLLNKDMYKLVHYATEEGVPIRREDTLIYRCMRENRSLLSDDEILWTQAGHSFPAQYSASPISEDGKPIGAVVVFRNIAEARALARHMDYLATHDSLTDLYNRREFELRLKNLLEETEVEKSEHILCYMDLDQFKVVNDTCGHVAGDELLRQLSSVISTKIRKHDTLARLGGDEFGLLLAHCNLQSAHKIIDEIRHEVNDFRFIWEEKIFSIGISVGITVIDSHTDKVGTALSQADAACYIAKDSGRNRVHVYEKDNADIAHAIGEMRWVSVITGALDNNTFSLYYQPIVPIKAPNPSIEGLSTHFEILLRLQDTQGVYYPPGAFIPAAERYGLMGKIDTWVVAKTFSWLANHPDFLDKIELCSINLSASSLTDKAFLINLSAQLDEWDIPGDKICFEVTETAAVSNLTQAVHFIKTLKQYGCKFALDDFGSGMSSFAYLKNLPVDFLKIDGYFVRDILNDRIDAAMVEAVNKVGQVMGIKTIAEFVENSAILRKLQAIGIDYAQGYGVAKPSPIAGLASESAKSITVNLAQQDNHTELE